MNYGDIKLTVEKNEHRSFSAANWTRWQQVVKARIENDLRYNDELTLDTAITPTSNPFYVALKSGDIRAVYIAENGRERRIQAAAPEQVINYLGVSGAPRFYASIGERIWVAPWVADQEYRILYRARLGNLTDDTDTTTVSQNWPQLYILLFGYEVATRLKDFDSADRYEQQYQAELQRITNQERKYQALADTQMTGASSWV